MQVSYLFITHNMEIVEAIADSVAVMHRGEVVRYGDRASVFRPPFDAYTTLLLSSVPEMRPGWLDAKLHDRRNSAISDSTAGPPS
jgi:peptide/nickel transport system ATP-binding protein